MLPEPLILGGDGRADGDRGDLIEAYGDAHAVGGIAQQRRAVAIDDYRAGRRRLLLERRQRGEVGVGEQGAGGPEGARSGREADPQQRTGPVTPQDADGDRPDHPAPARAHPRSPRGACPQLATRLDSTSSRGRLLMRRWGWPEGSRTSGPVTGTRLPEVSCSRVPAAVQRWPRLLPPTNGCPISRRCNIGGTRLSWGRSIVRLQPEGTGRCRQRERPATGSPPRSAGC